ncbi:MAG TPA: serine hydrolase [Pyrinomonadaceae bacterium]|nr:serine hydrolase [Pyrinomonadaceae bacterium]
MLKKTFLLSLVVVLSLVLGAPPMSLAAQTAGAQQSASANYDAALAKIEKAINERREALGIPGAALAIVKDGKVIYAKGLGYKDFEKKIPVTADTQFAIGSATKAFTALSVLIAQDQGKLSLDDSPKKYLPYFKINDPETDKKIVVRDLLDHSSGLTRTDLAMLTGQLTRKELIEVAGEAVPTAKLHEKFQYQNIMYAAAGEIAATVEKSTWNKVIASEIFKPLGMTNSTTTIPAMTKAKDYSFGYEYNFDTKATKRLPFRDIGGPAPAGAINSSVNDMARWLEFVAGGGEVKGKRIVSEKGFEEWTKPQMKIAGKMSYGLGWFIEDWHGLKVVQHGGNIDGFNAMVAVIPEKKLGFVLLTNVSGSPLTDEAKNIIWSDLLPEAVAQKPAEPGREPAQAFPKVSADALVGTWATATGTLRTEIRKDGDKVTLNVPGQQPYPLIAKPDNSFSLSPLPDSFSISAKVDASGKVTAISLVQPQGTVELLPAAPTEKPAITAEELHKKVIAALGGEENLRGLKSRVIDCDVDFVNQGVTGTTRSYTEAPNLSATATTLSALGKTLGKAYEFFDGTNGGEASTFAPAEDWAGLKLDNSRLAADFYGMLNWDKNFSSIDIGSVVKVDGKDTYAVKFTPKNGTEYTVYFSTETFLPVKQNAMSVSSTSKQRLPFTEEYSDYRKIDGVMVPFVITTNSLAMGKIVVTVKDIKQNVRIDASVFTHHDVTLDKARSLKAGNAH